MPLEQHQRIFWFMIHSNKDAEGPAFLPNVTLEAWGDMRIFQIHFSYEEIESVVLEGSWNVMAHAQKPDFVFRRNGRVHLNRPGGRQFSRLLTAEVCASAVVMSDIPCSEVAWRVLTTHYIRQFPLHFPSRASPCAITFQLESTKLKVTKLKFWYNIVIRKF